jgi:hypothetical protein
VTTGRRVSKREFFREPYKHLDKLPVIVTNRGVDEIFIMEYSDKLVTLPLKPTPKIVAKKSYVVEDTYGCGECPCVPGQKTCKKHGRM